MDSTKVLLEAPSVPVSMLAGYLTTQETTLAVHCHDKIFRKVTAVGADGRDLFHVEGAPFGTSWSWRRKVFDPASRAHVFDFRHESASLRNGWVVEDGAGRALCRLAHRHLVTAEHSALDATLVGAGEGKGEGEARGDVVSLRQNDRMGTTASVVAPGGAVVAVIYKSEDNAQTVLGGKDRSVWVARVAANVDLSLIMVLALARAEMGHVWKQ